jgi:putative transposase
MTLDVAAWRTRPLERVYPIVYLDALMVKVREDRSVRTRAWARTSWNWVG